MSQGENINYFVASRGFWSWVITLDHKRIGLMYLASSTMAFMLGGIYALLLRFELLTPTKLFFDADAYNQLFSLHGIIMVFLFIIPAIPAALGNFILPMQLGAMDVAFPRLNLFSYYLYATGALMIIFAIAFMPGIVDTGWTFYVPYSISQNPSVIMVALAIFIMGFSSILTGLNFIVTVHKLRAPGLSWFRLPLFVWALYATSVIQVLATPVLAITLALVAVENFFGIGIFDPALGGDPVLFQHFFWFYSHPAVYIMIVPAFGIISELITAFSKRDIFGYRFIAFSSIAIALIGFLVWGHHMFVAGQALYASMIFSFLTFFVGIPTAVKIFNWMATLYKGSIELKTPMIYTLAFLFLFTVGGLTGVMLGMISVDIHLHDTYFVVAHFHYVMMGGNVIAFLGGVHYWWPKMTGRMYNEFWGALAACLVFVGFNMTFFIQFVMGSLGMPRRYYTYDPEFQFYHVFSTVGSWVVGLGLFMALFNLLISLRSGQKAPGNPWGAKTLEWQSPSPPPVLNFEHPETVVVTAGPYAFDSEKSRNSVRASTYESEKV